MHGGTPGMMTRLLTLMVALTFASIETVAESADLTSQVRLLGNPSRARYSASSRIYARNVWDMQRMDGRIYLGSGNSSNQAPASNAGPVDVWYWDSQTQAFENDITIPQEQLDLFRIIEGKLTTPAHDPRGATLDDYYQREENVWTAYTSIPANVHNYDIAVFEGEMFAAMGTGLHVSADGGTNWTKATIVNTSPIYPIFGSGRTYRIITWQGELYAVAEVTVKDKIGNTTNFRLPHLLHYDGNATFSTIDPEVYAGMFPGVLDARRNTDCKIMRSVVVGNQLVYLGSENVNDHQWEPQALFVAEALGQGRQITLDGNAKPWDIVVGDDGVTYALGSIKLAEGDYKITVSYSHDLVTWIELFRFDSDTYARSFELLEGVFYFGLGCDYNTSFFPESTGNILALEGVIHSDVDLSEFQVSENAAPDTVIGEFSVAGSADQEAETYELVVPGGDAGGRFKVEGRLLEVAASSLLDYEAATTHTVRVRAAGSGGSDAIERSFEIAVLDVNEAPTDMNLSATSIPENAEEGQNVATIATLDPDLGDSHLYNSIPSYPFIIQGGVLEVSAGGSLDFEVASSHTVTVRAIDRGGLWLERQFVIAVTDVNEAPSDITLSSYGISENAPAGSVVGRLAASDEDEGESASFAVVAGADGGGRFVVVGDQVRVAAGTGLDHEGAASHAVTVRATDKGGLTLEKSFTIEVLDVNEPPHDITLSGNGISENAAAGSVVGRLSASDEDAGDSAGFAFISGGDGEGRFVVVGDEVRVAAGAELDHESVANHAVTVRVTDAGGLALEKTLVIEVSDVNEPPVVDLNGAEAGVNGATRLMGAEAAVALFGFPPTIADPDSDAVAWVTIEIEPAPGGAEERIEVTTTSAMIAMQYGATSGTLRLTGPASAADFCAVLASARYVNSLEIRGAGERTIRFIASDGEAESASVECAVQLEPLPLLEVLIGEIQVANTGGVGLGVLGEAGGAAFNQSLVLLNRGSAPLTIDSVEVENGELLGNPPAMVDSGSTATLLFAIPLQQAGPSCTDVRIMSNDSRRSPFELTLEGEVLASAEEPMSAAREWRGYE